MAGWTGVVLALPAPGGDAMGSRLATCLHPVAGRPLLWHCAAGLAALQPPPREILVIGADLPEGLFHDLPVEVRAIPLDEGAVTDAAAAAGDALVVDATAWLPPGALAALREQGPGGWLAAGGAGAAAARLQLAQLPELLRLPEPLAPPNGVLPESGRLADSRGVVVRDRTQLAGVVRAVRDQLVEALMHGGATFLLPESVMVEVDVRVGRDSVIYPGVVLEGQTTIGEETVIGPGCRVIDSWIGSGVELKGWNYISHTSIRNRAILEPYVRRGFD